MGEALNSNRTNVTKLVPSTYPRPEKYFAQSDGLRSVLEIPQPYRTLFADFDHFNQVQSAVFDAALYSDVSIVLGAPTGSGKTVLFELAIVQLLMRLEDETPAKTDFKIIYIAPLKAICGEKFAAWRRCLDPLGVRCACVTGDRTDADDLRSLAAARVLLTTPEKWDSLSRKWADAPQCVASIRLVMVDEVHLLNDGRRGATLEAVITRMKMIEKQNSMMPKIRFLNVSSTIPNIDDLAAWIGDEGGSNVKYFSLPEAMRPVKLERYVFGFPLAPNQNEFVFDMHLNYRLPGLIHKYGSGKPTLIFCSTRSAVEAAAKGLPDRLRLRLGDEHTWKLHDLAKCIKNPNLRALLVAGVAFHHAGLGPDDRQLIETHFRAGEIPVLLSTNTLAMGVNLPAHMVIVKSTQNYQHGSLQELSGSALLQMIGRAGRPQFDDRGIAIILTQQQQVSKYQLALSGLEPIESQLLHHLSEHLNAEIVLGTITDLRTAMEWMRSTFLYVRVRRHPERYGLRPGELPIESQLEEICLAAINELVLAELVRKHAPDLGDGRNSIEPTAYGRLMAVYYVGLATMRHFRAAIKGTEGIEQVFDVITGCPEFDEHRLRVADKRALNEINAAGQSAKTSGVGENRMRLRYPIDGRVQSARQKVSCLLQARLGNVPIPDSALMHESDEIVRLAKRLASALLEFVRARVDTEIGSFRSLLSAVRLVKSMRSGLWDDSAFSSQQIDGISAVCARKLANMGMTTVQALRSCDPRTIELILGKSPPFGDQVIATASALPSIDSMQVTALPNHREFRVEVRLNDQPLNDTARTDFVLLVGDTNQNVLLFVENITPSMSGVGVYERMFSLRSDDVTCIRCHLIHHTIVGIDQCVEIPIRKNGSDSEIDHIVKERNTVKRRFVGPLQPSVKDYFKCVDKDLCIVPSKRMSSGKIDYPGSSKVISLDINDPVNRMYEKQSVEPRVLDQSNPNDEKHIDIGLTAEELLAMPCTPPLRPKTPPGRSSYSNTTCLRSNDSDGATFSADIADMLEYVRGRPTETESNNLQLGDFDEWLVSNDDPSSDEYEPEFVWPTQSRAYPNTSNAPTAGVSGSAFDVGSAIGRRAEEDQRIDSLLMQPAPDVRGDLMGSSYMRFN